MKIFINIIFCFLMCGVSYAKYESGTNDAASVVLYGKNSGTLVPIQVDSNGKMVTSGGGGSSFPDITDISPNVGIGSTSPGATLDVQGTIRVLGTYAASVGGQTTVINGSGNIGIGTSIPGSSLVIKGILASGIYYNGQESISTTGNSYDIDHNQFEVGPGLYIGKNYVDGGTTDEHGMVIFDTFARGTHAYASYDNQSTMSGSSSMDHMAGYQSRPTINLSGGAVLTNLFNFYSLPFVTGGTVTNLYHIYLRDASVTGADVTNEYGLYMEHLASANAYGIYESGANPNYFAGNIGIGTLSPGDSLDVNGTVRLSNNGTFIGKIQKRITAYATTTSITPNSDTDDISYMANSQGSGTFTVNADGGTHQANGQSWTLKISSTSVQTFSWNSQYVGGTLGLPTSTLGTSTIEYFCFMWDSVNSKWDYTGHVGGF